jgi:hypothetical protein
MLIEPSELGFRSGELDSTGFDETESDFRLDSSTLLFDSPTLFSRLFDFSDRTKLSLMLFFGVLLLFIEDNDVLFFYTTSRE